MFKPHYGEVLATAIIDNMRNRVFDMHTFTNICNGNAKIQSITIFPT